MDLQPCCKNCRHFRLHDIRRSRGNYTPLLYGHCVKPRRKKRDANTPACAYWEPAVQEPQK